MKVLNLYSGIGGNRKFWGNDIEVVAIEINPKIAKIYNQFFPMDKLIVDDAHNYLLNHFNEFDFIWSSPPCPTHSRTRKANLNQNSPIYPNMQLYEEILFLQGYFNGKWVVENVISWYAPLIEPFEVGNHYFWANFYIGKERFQSRGISVFGESVKSLEKNRFDLSNVDCSGLNKTTLLRNCIEPNLGKYVFDCAIKGKQTKIN